VLVLRNLFGPGIDMILAQEVILPNGTPTGTTSGGGGTRWLLADHLGTIRDIVDNAGAVLNHILYDSFGNILSQTDPLIATRYAFTGREFDAETGLHYYRARYYDGAIGRFVSEDPIGFRGGDFNWFRYVYNSPMWSVDPTGEKAITAEQVQSILEFKDMAEQGTQAAGAFGRLADMVKEKRNIDLTDLDAKLLFEVLEIAYKLDPVNFTGDLGFVEKLNKAVDLIEKNKDLRNRAAPCDLEDSDIRRVLNPKSN